MSKMKSAITVAAAVASMFVFGQMAMAQNCGCESAPVTTFGYPAGNCGGGCGQSVGQSCGGRGGAGCVNEMKARIAHYQAQSEKIAARNAAWPKPFACADAQLYTKMWGPMINAGFEDQNLLTSVHFDKESGDLTRYGKNQVVGILKNMPAHRKVVFVQRSVDEATTQQRYNTVREVVDMWYGANGRVELSGRTAIGGVGLGAEKITQSYYESAPAPVIPIANGGESVGDSVGN